MSATPESLPRHELVGLRARVQAAANPDLLDIAGDVVLETTKTLGIEVSEGQHPSDGRTESGGSEEDDSSDNRMQPGDSGRVCHVPKEGTTFEFELSGEARDASTRQATLVTVEGRRLIGRPARRTENTGESKWR